MLHSPENYSLNYRNRVYYGNCCNLCFSADNLLKCASCLSVSYCSKKHQQEDWLFHKPTCIALKAINRKIAFPEQINQKLFFLYRRCLLDSLVRHRKVSDSSYLTQYEREICLLPWVCAVCFNKPSSNFECPNCESVIYCSSDHMLVDDANHSLHCSQLRFYRLIASLPYENGIKFKTIPSIYKKIRPSHKRWPRNRTELSRLVQNEHKIFFSEEVDISTYLFLKPYIPAATILNALEKSGFVKKRYFITKPSKPQGKIGKPRGKKNKKNEFPTNKSTLTIHFVISDDYELAFNWIEIAQLLSDWLINVNNVEIVLTGPKLKFCSVPVYEIRDKLAGISVHVMPFQKVVCLKIPDIIVMLECQRSFNSHIDQFWNSENIDALFRYVDVPVIVASGDITALERICDIVTTVSYVEMKTEITENNFSDICDYREWKESLNVYSRNSYFVVFCIHEE